MTQLRIRYSIIPPGIGPDDYEPADLEQRDDLVDVAGDDPDLAAIHAAVTAGLAPGSGAAILQVRRPDQD
ncbi:hypothetical protein PV356_35535 [Streptomyces sp. WI03-5b]|uniref:hypothetical protein n=1 Tax=Streptomyces sp. WI03-5b TaxID=462946 RepID=UPI0029A6CE0E|nr:hypothetical protein [Streptomyces sp. WI03-5b]MDX2624730.1 hypothetical protein [Streptomyces sp. WI03-5b]